VNEWQRLYTGEYILVHVRPAGPVYWVCMVTHAALPACAQGTGFWHIAPELHIRTGRCVTIYDTHNIGCGLLRHVQTVVDILRHSKAITEILRHSQKGGDRYLRS
jgi:hypothetical protein